MNVTLRLLVLSTILLSCGVLSAGKVDTLRIPSKVMRKSFGALVFQPEPSILAEKRYPVLYLLHGHSSDYAGWTYIGDQLKEWVDQYQIIIVCPDGDYDSWYIDSPVRTQRKFASYLTQEVIPFIDQHYPSLPGPLYRGITGVSMGGHGAMYTALKNPDLIGIAGSISGALNLLPFEKEWNLKQILGDPKSQIQVWKHHSIFYLLDRYCRPDMPLRIDCGSEDFFLTVNRQVHQKLNALHVPHQYVETPGGHDIPYWTRIIGEQIRFFGMFWAGKQ